MRKLATFAASFAAGIFAAQYLLSREWQLPLCLAAGALSLTGLLFRDHVRLRVFLVCGGAALALGWNWCYTALVQLPAEKLAGETRVTTMVVQDYPERSAYGAKVTVRLEQENVRAVCYGDESLLTLVPGNTLSGAVELSSAVRIREDEVRTFTSRGVFLLAYSRGELTADEGSAGSPLWWPARLGRAMQERIGDLFPGDEGAFLTALLTGEKSGLSDASYTALTQTGMLHILAVSGMHCGFLLTLLEMLLGRHRRRLTAGAGIPALFFYAVLTGCSPSVVRACVMLGFFLLAPLAGRDSDLPTALAAALMAILLQNPFAAGSVSLQLSFGAVAGILWLTPRMTRFLMGRRKSRMLRFLVSSFSATAGALVFTVPLTAAYFGILVLASPVSNLLCLPVTGVIFVLGLTAVLLSFLWTPLGMVLGHVPLLLIRYVLWVAEGLSGLRYHAVYFANPWLKYWLALAYGQFLLAWALKRLPRWKYFGAAVCAAAALVLAVRCGAAESREETLGFTALDVGQGQCLLVSSAGKFALIDCGSANSWYDPGTIAADTLQSAGCFRLDYLFLTHYDSDHVSGVAALLDRMPVDTIVAPEQEDDSGLQAELLKEAEEHGAAMELTLMQVLRYSLGEAEVTVWPPLGDKEDNERGLTILVGAGENEILVTGDMDRETERLLMQRFDLPDVEVLVAGHHGAKSSTSNELLYVTTPEQVVVSVGPNAYGHPSEETLARLKAVGAEVLRTDLLGTIHISLN